MLQKRRPRQSREVVFKWGLPGDEFGDELLRLVGLTLHTQVVGYREDPRDAVCQERGAVTICLP